MLLQIGRGLSSQKTKQEILKPTLNFNFLNVGVLPPDIVVSRATEAIYFNADGHLAKAPPHTGRLHSEFGSGQRLGLLIEAGRTTKNHYARPSSGTLADHFTVTPAGLSIVSDTTAPITNDFTNSQNIWEFQNMTGSSVDLEWIGDVGSTNTHNIQIIYRMMSGDNCAFSLGGEGEIPLNSLAWNRETSTNITPSSTGDRLRLTVPDGSIIRFFMANMQEDTAVVDGALSYVTTPIDSIGAPLSRAADIASIPNLENSMNDIEGTIMFRAMLSGFSTALSRGIFGLTNSASSLIRHSLLYTNDVDILMEHYNGATSRSSEILTDAILPVTLGVAYKYKAGDTKVFSSGKSFSFTEASPLPSGLDKVTFYRPDDSSSVPTMIVRSLQYYDTALPDNVLEHASQTGVGSEMRVMAAGQSNVENYFSAYSAAGEKAFEEIMHGEYAYDNTLINGSTGGSAAHKLADGGAGWWYDPALEIAGSAYDDFLLRADRVGRSNIRHILWAQGEQDARAIHAGDITKLDYKASVLGVFEKMREDLSSNLQVFIQILGSTGQNDSLTADLSWQDIRAAQHELIAEYEWIHFACDSYDLTLADSVHLDQDGYEKVAQRAARRILSYGDKIPETGTLGPKIVSAQYSGSVITVTLQHDGGSDFAPSSGIEGFYLEHNGVPAVVNAAVRTDTNTISLTLANAIASGDDVRLWYGYGKMQSIDQNNIVHDNAGLALPLRTVTALAVTEI